ncbi:pilus assembly protein TadG-related protein [Celeribacter halophilus]|uniref:TadE/TadG family type IV pilus assembly protein n=1 Tax=Celeribacter halophilus TaxID=576117 RepID=UPI0026E256A3|nr:pilus assembly protein TadG-related protein [Celeribacter halophilus]MDO6723187.1 pilus assembly protein TadG-related protein [Celeribacter halophilus]
MLGKVESREADLHLLKMGKGPIRARLKATAEVWRLRRRFTRDEQGSITILGLFCFVIILLVAGMGLDFMRHEALRVELQNTLDRAVLAATNLRNTNDPEDIVIDYFEKAGLREYLNEDEIVVTPLGDGRQVTANVEATIPTYFLKIVSIDDLEMTSHSTAEQGISGLEVALVLDVSGSMNSYSRLKNLKSAAKEFTQTIFDNAGSDEVSISIVPYATQVNAGDDILSTFNLTDAHDKSYCLNFEESDFSSIPLTYKNDEDTTRYYEQTLDFDPWYSDWDDLDEDLTLEVCAPDSSREVLAFTNSQDTIETYITNLYAEGNTSIDLGVKWGAALLDESAQAISGTDQPASAEDSQKYLVVMTDGENTAQYYIPDPYRDGYSTDVYRDKDGRVFVGEDYESCSSYKNKGKWYYYNCSTITRYTRLSNNDIYTTLPYDLDDTDDIWELSWPEVWSTMTVYNHAYARYLAAGKDADVYYDWLDKTQVYIDADTKDDRLSDICTAAKNAGTIIFAIGFEAPDDGQEVMQDCASSDSHYYDVEGTEISEAFAAIASKITELRLVE